MTADCENQPERRSQVLTIESVPTRFSQTASYSAQRESSIPKGVAGKVDDSVADTHSTAYLDRKVSPQ
jgi:hypothetical protein